MSNPFLFQKYILFIPFHTFIECIWSIPASSLLLSRPSSGPLLLLTSYPSFISLGVQLVLLVLTSTQSLLLEHRQPTRGPNTKASWLFPAGCWGRASWAPHSPCWGGNWPGLLQVVLASFLTLATCKLFLFLLKLVHLSIPIEYCLLHFQGFCCFFLLFSYKNCILRFSKCWHLFSLIHIFAGGWPGAMYSKAT